MLSIPSTTLMYLVEPLLKEIIKDIITAGIPALEPVKAKLFEAIKGITGNNNVIINNDLFKTVAKSITNSDLFHVGGGLVLDCVAEWVKHSETKWDDFILLPVIDYIRVAAGMPEGAGK